ncbi:thioredoxin domain-containing protein bug [Megalopta genalis]|uniref:thioredoxin domain-containing protein bug n=1 Tax=Megalopta genalis TaxID=115081 RepID=UPI00144344D1|nr:thioredoxin domain-containing protein 15 [Megalopta genalis]
MFSPRRNFCLFIIVLVQTLVVLGQIDKEEITQTIPFKSPDKKLESDIEPTEPIKSNQETKSDTDPVITSLDATEIKTEDLNKTIEANVTLNNSTSNVTKVNCLTDTVYGPVEIANATSLMKLLILEPGPTNRSRNDKENRPWYQVPGTCIIVLFYARWCVFSSHAAPHFNALPRSFPHIKAVAIDAIKYQIFNAQYGIVGVPTLMLIHNGKPVAKFDDNVYTLESFSRFITYLTNLQPNGSLYVTSLDFAGPVSSTPSNETDYCLVLSWVFIAACALYFTLQSRWWQQFVELVQNTWRESNAQHEHAD